MLSKYNFILWDFDGVIIDSNPARVLGFKKVLADFPKDQVEKLLDFHHQNGGLSRYVKFRYFYEIIRGEKVEEEEVQNLAMQFSVIMKEILANPNLLIIDSLSFIKKNYSNVPMHIVSGSDGIELRYLCNQLGISQYFKSISGSPTPKIELVKQLIDSNSILNLETCLIGDAGNDFDAAMRNGIDFYGYNNISLIGIGKGYIDKFEV
jgi:phosphoglycolate phosphatase-like HAD superfamily hydrolase